jgi:hypothetical protein
VITSRRAVAVRVVGVLLLVLAVASTATGVIATVREREQVACQGKVNGELAAILSQLSRALTERSDASAAAQRAERDMLGVILDPRSTTDARREALNKYYAGLQHSDTTRAENPLPSFTANTCQ